MRITFAQLSDTAKQHGWNFEREDGSYYRYILFSNEKAPGMELCYETLKDAKPYIEDISNGKMPCD